MEAKTNSNQLSQGNNSKFYSDFDDIDTKLQQSDLNDYDEEVSPKNESQEQKSVTSNTDEIPQDNSLFAGFKRHLEKSKWGKRIVNEIADIDIKFNIKLFDVDLLRRYRYRKQVSLWRLSLSYVDNYYDKVDTWRLNANVRPGDMISKILSLRIEHRKRSRSSFIRQFKSKSRAY